MTVADGFYPLAFNGRERGIIISILLAKVIDSMTSCKACLSIARKSEHVSFFSAAGDRCVIAFFSVMS